MMSDKTKERRFTFRIEAAAAKRLEDLAKARGLKPSALIRRALLNLLKRAA